MPVTSTIQDPEKLTLTIVADLAAPPKRTWQVWVDPRQLERWWGPPTWPATFVEHDVAVGGRSFYYMTGPQGDRMHGAWQFVSVDEPRGLAFDDWFADATGARDTSKPVVRADVALDETATGTRMTITSHFATVEQMQELADMGMAEGMTEAMGQLDEVLAEG
ncbi:MAG TPA: SRPBCC domain-containing protein [Actinotalea sp.]